MNAIFASSWEQVSIYVLFWLIHLGWIGLLVGVVAWVGDRAFALNSTKASGQTLDGRSARRAYGWSMCCFLLLIGGVFGATVLSGLTAPHVIQVVSKSDAPVSLALDDTNFSDRNVAADMVFSKTSGADLAEVPSDGGNQSKSSNDVQPLSTSVEEMPLTQTGSFFQSQLFSVTAICVSVVYFFGCCAMLVRLVLASWGCRRISRAGERVTDKGMLALAQKTAAQMGLKLTPILATCERVVVPVVVGLIRPVVLLPVSIVSELTPDQLRAILAHEMAHLKRYDHVVVVFQRIVEAVLFFHPTTWWLSRRLDSQRELCCDDLVLQTGTSPLEYAETLFLVAQSRKANAVEVNSPEVALAADGANASEILVRISRVLNGTLPSPKRKSNNFGAANFGVGMLLVGLPVLLVLCSFINSNFSDPPASSVAALAGESSALDDKTAYGTIRGVIRDENGDLVTGATVILQEHPHKYLSNNVVIPLEAERVSVPPIIFAQSRTGMDGEFSFSDIEVPDYQKYFDSPFPITILIIHDDYGMTWRHIQNASTQKVEYTLKKGAPISFKVESNTGKPLKNVTARFYGALSKHDWNTVHPYRRIPAELIRQGIAVNLAIESKNNGLIETVGAATDNSFLTKKSQPNMVAVFEVGADQHVTDLFYVTNIDIAANPKELKKNDFATAVGSGAVIKLRDVVALKLKVSDQDGKPVAGVELEADKYVQTKNRIPPVVTKSDAPGEFDVLVNSEADGKPFKMHLRTKSTSGLFLNSERMLEIDPAKPNQSFEVKLSKGSPLKGKVVDSETGKPIEGVVVQFRPHKKRDNSKSDPVGPFHRASLGKSNASGEFVLNVQLDEAGKMPAGKLIASEAVEGYQTWTFDKNRVGRVISATVAPSSKAELVLKLPPDPSPKNIDSFQVKVLDENGKPAARAKVRFHCRYTAGSFGMPDTQRTDQDGLLNLDDDSSLFNFQKIAVVVISEDEKSAATAVYERPEKLKTMEEIVEYMKQLREGKSIDEPSVVLTVNLKPMSGVKGQVIDAISGDPVPFAKVRLSQRYVEKEDELASSFHVGQFFPFVEADKDGAFEVNAIPKLQGHLDIQHPNYLKRNSFTDADYFVPKIGEVVERFERLVAKEVRPSDELFPLPDLGDRKGVEALEFLQTEFKSARREFRNRLKNGDGVDALVLGRNSPATVYLPKILEIADSHRGKPAEVKALVWGCSILINTSEDEAARRKTQTEIGNRLMEDYIESPEIVDCLDHLIYSQPDPKAAADKIFAANKDKAVRGNVLLLIGQMAVMESQIRLRGVRYAKWSKQMKDEELEVLAHETFTRIKQEYADVPYWRSENLGNIAEMQLFEFDHLGVGDEVEDIVGKDSQGMPLKLSDYRGKIVVLDFWGSWCGPCIADLPKLNKIAKDFADDIVVLGVMEDTEADAKAALAEHNIKWRNWIEPGGGPIGTRWNIDSWPTNYLIGRDGKIIAKSLRGRQLYEAIEKHLDEEKAKKK